MASSSSGDAAFGWIKEAFIKSERKHEDVVKRFDDVFSNVDKSAINHDNEPVNILILDGEGLKGYALLAMMEVLGEEYGKRHDLLSHFDLLAGTSAGGALALIASRMGHLPKAIVEGKDILDDLREGILSEDNAGRSLFNWSPVRSSLKIKNVLEKRFGGDEGLFEEESTHTPTMILSTMHKDCKNCPVVNFNARMEYEPVVLRTYAYPEEDVDNFKDHPQTMYYDPDGVSTSYRDSTLCEAMASTTILPGFVNCLKMNIQGRERSVADGFRMASCSAAIAIDEARKLYPHRPIGVVLSIGSSPLDETFTERVVMKAQEVYPTLHFHRIAPYEIMDTYSSTETDLSQIAIMEEKCRLFFRNNKEVKADVAATIEKLFRSKKLQRDNGTGRFSGNTLLSESESLIRTQYHLKTVEQERRLSARKIVREQIVSRFQNSISCKSFISSWKSLETTASERGPFEEDYLVHCWCCLLKATNERTGNHRRSQVSWVHEGRTKPAWAIRKTLTQELGEENIQNMRQSSQPSNTSAMITARSANAKVRGKRIRTNTIAYGGWEDPQMQEEGKTDNARPSSPPSTNVMVTNRSPSTKMRGQRVRTISTLFAEWDDSPTSGENSKIGETQSVAKSPSNRSRKRVSFHASVDYGPQRAEQIPSLQDDNDYQENRKLPNTFVSPLPIDLSVYLKPEGVINVMRGSNQSDEGSESCLSYSQSERSLESFESFEC